MGCQASKGAKSPQKTPTPASPSKTLLEGAEAKQADGNASAPMGSGVYLTPTPLAAEQGEAQTSSSGAGQYPSSGEPTSFPSHMSTGSTNSRGLLRKHRVLCTSKKELDIMVAEFSSHDSTVGSVLGRNCKEMRWKVMYDRDADPIDIQVHVQEHKLHSNEVAIECNGQAIFHGAGSHAKSKMTEDFCYQWPFRGSIQGINELDFFEVNPAHGLNFSGEAWFPATITAQREDGLFEVSAREQDQSGRIIEVKYPAVHQNSLREAATRKPLTVPENCLTLDVPKNDPLRAVLSLANGELVTHHFGRPSPPVGATQEKAEIALKVSKDRSAVTANVGHQVLSHFVSGEVQAQTCEVDRLRHSWSIQAGPFAHHTVEITKKHTLGKLVTLLVDGTVLVEASAAEIGCQGSEWQCPFRLVGERVLDFEVYKTNAEGGVLEERGNVKERRKYVHECYVTIPNDWDFTYASLFIDGVPFGELPTEQQRYEEPNLTMAPLALLQSYGISTPYMVDRYAPSNMMLLANQVVAKATDSSVTARDWFALCCNTSSVVTDGGEIKCA